jgi:sulfur-oxidizing protein SoxA
MRHGFVAFIGLLPLLTTMAQGAPHSGYADASPPVQAMQDDDTANPGFLWVQQGEAIWSDAAVPSGQSCQSCHGAGATMRGVAARYPAYDPRLGRPLTLAQRIALCRTERQRAAPFPTDSDEALAIEAYVANQSRGLPIHVDTSGPAQPFAAHGRSLFETRMGQLNLSCAQCHDGLAGQHLAGATIPQGQPNGYPLYRLEWQALGSLYHRIVNCMTGVRAEPFAADSRDLVDLEFYLAARADGLPIETPGVRP